MSGKAIKLAAALAILSPVSAAQAATVIDTGPGGAFGGGYSLYSAQGLAALFTIASDFTITSAEGWIGGVPGGTVDVGIYNADTLNGTPIGSALFTASFITGANGWQGVSGQNWNLAAGTYFLGFTTANASSYMPSGVASPAADYAGYHPASQGWYNAGGLNIGVRAFGEANVGAVPEPGTWVMMLIGFGAVGAGMRYRRRQRVRVDYA